jgi:hypothetical protein
MKEYLIMRDNYLSKATAAMAESIDSILACDDDGETKAKALAESFRQLETYLTKHLGDGGAGDTDSDHHVSRLADLIVEGSGGKVSREMALTHLLHSRDGAALLHRMRTTKRNENDPMTKTEIEAKLAENVRKMGAGAIEIAKAVIAKEANVVDLTEEEFTAVITAHAQKMYPNDRADVAFSKVFSSDETIRRAYAIVKSLPPTLDFQPIVVSGATTFQDGLADRSEAYNAIVEMARKLRERVPELTEAKAFERTISDPTNRALAERALSRPLPPSGGYAFPRTSSPGRQ